MAVVNQAPHARRKDAIANETKIIAAASELFAERGIDAPIPAIARRAGVGKATVYRNFPTKADLIAALAVKRLEAVQDSVDRALAQADPAEAFARFTEEVLLMQLADHGVGDALRREVRPDIVELRRKVVRGIGRVLKRGQDVGVIRRDRTGSDFRLLISGVAGELIWAGEHSKAAWRRYASVITDAFWDCG
jgi:AcrR family transcriptional regulator